MKTFLPKSKRGFTILETLVAVFVITIAITATLTAAQTGLQSSYYARDQVTAFYLAEEAIEQVRNIRDSNYVATTSCAWLQGGDTSLGCNNSLEACLPTVVGDTGPDCIVDVVSNAALATIRPCSGSECVMNFNETLGYNHAVESGSNVPSKYRRTVSIELVKTNEARITSNVSWSSGPFGSRSFTVREVLFDWNLR